MFIGLNRKILLPLLLIFAFILYSSLLLFHLKAKKIIENELEERFQKEVTVTSKMIDIWLLDRKVDIQNWSVQDVLHDALTESGNPEKQAQFKAHQFLQRSNQGHSCYESLFLVNETGIVTVSSLPGDVINIDVSQRAYFQEAMKGDVAISDQLYDMKNGLPIIVIAVPLTKEGKNIGILAGIIPIPLLSNLFTSDYSSIDKIYAYIINREGNILAASTSSEFVENAAAPDNFFKPFLHTKQNQFVFQRNNKKYLCVFKQLEQTTWYFAITQSMDVTFAPLTDFSRISWIIAILGLMAGTILVVVLFKILVLNRLQTLVHGMQAVTKGNYQNTLPLSSYSVDEITELTRIFNTMTVKIEEMVSALNCEIQARTAIEMELTKHQDNLEVIISKRTEELETEISQRKEIESKLARAQRLEMIGTLAGGVAHDLNNILSGVVSYPDFLLRQILPDNPLYAPLLTIKKSGLKAAAIVQDLLSLARRGLICREIVNLNKIIDDFRHSLEFTKMQEEHPAITITQEQDPNLLSIEGSPIHLTQTIMNLVLNGMEAMKNGGTLTIRSENIYLDTSTPLYEEIGEGSYVRLSICDQGEGIAKEDMDRIFEPFYSTKKIGRSGSGLGMAIVWATIKDHNGYINCESKRDTGTIFSLYFPVTQKSQKESAPALAPQDLRGKGEHILVIDDIHEQREIAETILKNLGYEVSTASSGEEAVILCRKKDFDLILLDMVLGTGMDGLDTYRAILQHRPQQRAIISSGYSEGERIRETMKAGAGQYLKKPYITEVLATALRKELKTAP